MKIKLAAKVFKFSFFSLAIYFSFLILLIALGFWQLGRADDKRFFLENEQQSSTKESIKITTVSESDLENLRFRKVKLTGHYQQEHQYLIDNQILNGQPGYYVMTPFTIDGMDKAVLVNRGWLPLNKDRRILPELSISTLKTNLSGRINHFPKVGIVLAGADIPTDGWPSVVQVVDVVILSKRLGYSLLPIQIELDADMNDGYTREWKNRVLIPPEKHIAYALQWFGLAFTLTVLFFWFSKVTRNK